MRNGPIDQLRVGQVGVTALEALSADEFTDALAVLVEQVMEVSDRNMVCRGDHNGGEAGIMQVSERERLDLLEECPLPDV
ncbi:hypothetical protein [Actinomadura verrucosospora]|uniref:hypothetical protein n=1 Tax=Actinomadura verrucosospora TaxID=46165 RepID=UPI001FE2EAAC|nr:hypothetical protein [Actinomadura verrucosospora]